MTNNITKEDILNEFTRILVNEFEIDKNAIVPDAKLFEDLELDSIDAIDIAVRMQQFTSKKLSPSEFKKIKTVKDVVEVVYSQLQ